MEKSNERKEVRQMQRLKKWLVKLVILELEDGWEERINTYKTLLRDLEERIGFYNQLLQEVGNKLGECSICQYQLQAIERRISISEAKQTRLKQKVHCFFKKEGKKI